MSNETPIEEVDSIDDIDIFNSPMTCQAKVNYFCFFTLKVLRFLGIDERRSFLYVMTLRSIRRLDLAVQYLLSYYYHYNFYIILIEV